LEEILQANRLLLRFDLLSNVEILTEHCCENEGRNERTCCFIAEFIVIGSTYSDVRTYTKVIPLIYWYMRC